MLVRFCHSNMHQKSQHALYEIMNCVKSLSRQALPSRGDKNEYDSNITQLLKMKAEQDQLMAEWLKQKQNVYVSATIQNEMIKIQ